MLTSTDSSSNENLCIVENCLFVQKSPVDIAMGDFLILISVATLLKHCHVKKCCIHIIYN